MILHKYFFGPFKTHSEQFPQQFVHISKKRISLLSKTLSPYHIAGSRTLYQTKQFPCGTVTCTTRLATKLWLPNKQWTSGGHYMNILYFGKPQFKRKGSLHSKLRFSKNLRLTNNIRLKLNSEHCMSQYNLHILNRQLSDHGTKI